MSVLYYCLRVGTGDSHVLRLAAPGGEAWIVIDGGPARSAPGHVPLQRFLAEQGVRRLALLVVTHLHEDHVGGLPAAVAELERIDEFWGPALPAGAAGVTLPVDPRWGFYTQRTAESLNAYRRLLAELLPPRCGRLRLGAAVAPGLLWQGTGGASLRVVRSGLGPGPAQADLAAVYRAAAAPGGGELGPLLERVDQGLNATSLVLHLQAAGHGALLAGDALAGWWQEDGVCPPPAAVLKLAHHGNSDATQPGLLQAVRPRLALCCVGPERPDLPHAAVRAAVAAAGAELVTSGGAGERGGVLVRWAPGEAPAWQPLPPGAGGGRVLMPS